MIMNEAFLETVVESGLHNIYCAATGFVIGELGLEEISRIIEIEESMNPLLEEEDFLDHLELTMIPLNYRPSPLFQNLTPQRYKQIAKLFPQHMFRFLAGKIIFEKWNQLAGFVKVGDKGSWLREIPVDAIVSPVELKDAVESLIRLDAIISLRQVYVSEALANRIERIRNGWTGYGDFFQFIQELESANIKKLAKRDIANDGKISGNQMAVEAAIHNATHIDHDEYMAVYTSRKAAESLNELSRQTRSSENMRKHKRKLAGIIASGHTTIKRGVEAVMDLADIGDTFDSELAKKYIAQMDTASKIAKLQNRINRETGVKNPSTGKVEKEIKFRKAKLTIDFGDM